MPSTPSQEFLERSQYNRAMIAENERLFGRNVYAMGGADEVARMLDHAGAIRPRRILDIGSGLGGPAFLMARRYGAHVDGIDIARAMHELSVERLAEEALAGQVRFLHGNVLEHAFDGKYDLVFSSNVFLHIHDKARLLDKIHSLLDDGGRLLFGDYCIVGDSPDMKAYVEHWNYDIRRFDDWLDLLPKHGFTKAVAADCTERFADDCRRAIANPGIGDQWREILSKRLARIERGEHRWCVFCYERANATTPQPKGTDR